MESAGTVILLLIRWRINLLTMGEEDARAVSTPRKSGALSSSVQPSYRRRPSASAASSGGSGW